MGSVGYFKLNDTLEDESGTLSLINNGASYVDTPLGRGMTIVGSTDIHIDYNMPASEIIDLSIIVKTDSISSSYPDYANTIFCLYTGTDIGLSLFFYNDSDSNPFCLRLADRESIGVDNLDSATNIFSLHEYYKIRFLLNNIEKTINVYLDDSLVISATYTETFTNHSSIIFGQERGHTDYDLDGTIDEIELYANTSPNIDFIISSDDIPESVTDDYIARYKLQDNADDETGNFSGVSSSVVFNGESGYFDGTGDSKVEIPIGLTEALSGQAGATLSAMINMVSETGDNFAISIGDEEAMIGFSFENTDFSAVFNVDSNIKNIYTDALGIGGASKVHVLATIDIENTISVLYVNGVETDSRTFVAGTVFDDKALLSVIGLYSLTDPTYMPFEGKLSNVRLYGRALTSTEAIDVYNEDSQSISFMDLLIASNDKTFDEIIDFTIVSINETPVLLDFNISSEDSIPDFIDFEIASIAHRGVVIDFDITSTSTKDPEFINLNIISGNIPSDTESPSHYSAQLIRRVL